LETALRKKQVRNLRAAVPELLADELIEFGSSGKRFNKSQILDALEKEESDQLVAIEDFVARELAPGGFSSPTGPKVVHPAQLHLEVDRWKVAMVFHQGTKAP
jgi:hypothetical protein